MRLKALIILLLLCSTVLAQTKRIESIKAAILQAKSDEEASDLYAELADRLYGYDFESGLFNAEKALKMAVKSQYPRGVAQAQTAIGTYFFYKGENAAAREHYRLALAAVANTKTEDYPVRTYFRLAILYRQQGYFDSAFWHLDQAEKLLPSGEPGALHGSNFAIRGILANLMSQHDEALTLLKKSLVIRRTLPDSVRLADTWRNMGAVYSDMSMYDSAEYCYRQAFLIAEPIHDPEFDMLLSLSRGETNFEKGDHHQAIQNYNDAVDRIRANTYKRYYSYLLFKIGELYENQGAYNTAYDYLFGALKGFEEINDRQNMARVYSQIGWCYNFQENYSLAVENGRKALALGTEIGDSSSIAQNQNLIGYALLKSRNYKDALSNFDRALSIRKRIKHWWGVTYTLYNIALTYEQLGETNKAFELLFESLALNEQIGNKSGIVFTCNELGLLYAKTKQFAKAESYLSKAGALARTIPLPSQLVTNYQNYIFLSEAKNDYRKTISYFKLYTSLKDSLSNEHSSSRMAKADAMFQLEKKIEEIKVKNEENKLKQEQIEAQRGVIDWQRRALIAVFTGLIILTILLVVIYRLLQSRSRAKEILRKQNLEITEQKEEIQAQSEELTESNDKLSSLNAELMEKNHEIESQWEKIQEANNNLEKRVEERTQQLNVAYNELETFFYKTSHDFRRPLTTYLGLVEIANVSLQDKHALELFEKVKETTLGLDSMLIKLQSISNIDYESQRGEVAIQGLIESCLAKFRTKIEGKGIKVIVDSTVNTVYTNDHLCRVFLENMVENSINFCTPVNPFVRIHAAQVNGSFVVIIEDNGQGIPAAIQHRIFEMYFRGNDNSKGNGLGLYIAKRAIDKLGGSVTLMSRLNEGTSFKITIPV